MTRELLSIDPAGNLLSANGSRWGMWTAIWTPVTSAPRVVSTSARDVADDHAWAAWSPAARAEFLGRCDQADADFRGAKQTLCILPRASDPLSDVPGVLTFLRQRGTSNVRVVLDPALLLTPSMLATAEDHLARAILSIGHMPGLEAVILRNLRHAADGSLESVAIRDGVLPPEWLLTPARQLPSHVPIAVLPPDLAIAAAITD